MGHRLVPAPAPQGQSTGLEVENRPLEVQGAPQGARVTVGGGGPRAGSPDS